MHETWELKELSDEERAQYGDKAMVLEIDKSRGMRGGDRFLVQEDIEEALSIEDLTPTVTRENQGQGDETPRTLVLGILKAAEAPMTAKDIRYALNAKLAGHRGPGVLVSEKTVKRWAKRWVVAGLVEESKVRQPGGRRGQPLTAFSVKTPICEAKVVQKYASIVETPFVTGDLNNGQGLSVNTALSDMSVIPRSNPHLSQAKTLRLKCLWKMMGEKPAETPPGITDISDTKEQLSVIP